MHSRRWVAVVMVGLVCAVAFTGCKRKPRKGAMLGDNVGGVTGTDVYGEGLADRFGEGRSEVAGQFTPVYFDYDSAQINESERGKLDQVADYIRRNAAGGMVVEGHCDERGSNEYNLGLGERRALAIRSYLVQSGVDAARLQTKSFGEERPVAAGHDEGSWSQNRRGEFVLVQ